MTSSFTVDIADLSGPDTFLLAQNHDNHPCGRKSSVSPRCDDDGICHADVDPASEVPETPPRTCQSSGGDSVSDNDGDSLMSRCTLSEGEEGLLDLPRSKVQTSLGQAAETSSSFGSSCSRSSLHSSRIRSRGSWFAETNTSSPSTLSNARSAKRRPRRNTCGLRTREGSKIISGSTYVFLRYWSDGA